MCIHRSYMVALRLCVLVETRINLICIVIIYMNEKNFASKKIYTQILCATDTNHFSTTNHLQQWQLVLFLLISFHSFYLVFSLRSLSLSSPLTLSLSLCVPPFSFLRSLAPFTAIAYPV